MPLTSLAALDRWADLSDEQVVAEVLTGHTALFEALMRRHNQQLYRTARAILRNEAEAEDVMQQAYVNAFAHLRQFDGRSRFATWLIRIAVYESLSRLRQRGRDAGPGPGGTDPRSEWCHRLVPHRIPSGWRSPANSACCSSRRSIGCPMARAKCSCSDRWKA